MTSEQEEMHRMLTVRVNALSDDVDRFRAELCKVADRAEQADRSWPTKWLTRLSKFTTSSTRP
jgi:hypothetical protein